MVQKYAWRLHIIEHLETMPLLTDSFRSEVSLCSLFSLDKKLVAYMRTKEAQKYLYTLLDICVDTIALQLPNFSKFIMKTFPLLNIEVFKKSNVVTYIKLSVYFRSAARRVLIKKFLPGASNLSHILRNAPRNFLSTLSC